MFSSASLRSVSDDLSRATETLFKTALEQFNAGLLKTVGDAKNFIENSAKFLLSPLETKISAIEKQVEQQRATIRSLIVHTASRKHAPVPTKPSRLKKILSF